MKKLLLAACTVAILAACQSPLDKKIAVFEQDVELIRESLQNVGLAVAYVENGQLVYQHSFGFKNLETQEPLTDDCLFRIASISKSFTTTSLLQLVEQGKLSLQDDVSKLIGFPVRNPRYPYHVITLEMLLSHTSSLNDNEGYFSLRPVNPEQNENWAKCYNEYAPGEGYEYCNLNLNMAGTILERVSGERFDEYVRHHVLEPLGLYGGYCCDSLDWSRFVPLYEWEDGHFENVYNEAYVSVSERLKTYVVGDHCTPMFSPTGGMKISAPDLARYMIMHMNYGEGVVKGNKVRIIPEDLARDMQVPRSEDENYGLTLWQTDKYSPNVTLVGHTGGVYGLRSAMFFNPEEKYGYVVISNGAVQGGEILTRTLRLMHRTFQSEGEGVYIRLNQLGYLPHSSKVAVVMSRLPLTVKSFAVVNAETGKTVYKSKPADIVETGAMGQMKTTYRLNFSKLEQEGTYYLKIKSPQGSFNFQLSTFNIKRSVYDGTADFVLNYMRQQRCGWNPFMQDSCHVHDGIIVNHPTKSGQHIDVRGGWHDASDCLQYVTTTANAIYQMMFAYKANPQAFKDNYLADGTVGSNGIPDIIDEIYWGMDWLDRMNPAPDEFYNQLADDRDHVAMTRPADDKADYGWGVNSYRPVYFIDCKPQQRGQFLNATMGAASTVGKYASDFALGSEILAPYYPEFAEKLKAKALNAYQFGVKHPGQCQTVSVRSPYIYEEDNWVDDMELGAIEMYHLTGEQHYWAEAIEYARREPITPWMGADSARHYQWYPFMNVGHYHLAKEGNERVQAEFIRNLRTGIERTLEKAKGTPFLYGIPSIWCSNNLTTAMLTQCILYRQLTGDEQFMEMEGALRDWLLGCNPWGVSMIVELPKAGNYPHFPHSFITTLQLGKTTGGLVDGPVYRTIFESLRGVYVGDGNAYEDFQPDVMVYHDSSNDYSTNEPTMDGTACLTFPFSAYEMEGRP